MLLPPPTTGSSLTFFTVTDVVTGPEHPPRPSETWNENTSGPTKSCAGWQVNLPPDWTVATP